MERSAPRPRRRRRERGSAYIVALLVLVLLTIFGMSLALITQTESQIGAAEKAATRAFFSGDAGFGVSAARKLVTNSEGGLTLDIHTRTTLGGVAVTERFTLSPLVLTNLANCTLCALNETQVQGNQPRRTNHVVNSTGEIQGASASDAGISSSKLLSLMPEIQPIVPMIPADLDPGAAERIARLIAY